MSRDEVKEPDNDAKCWVLQRIAAFLKDGGGSFRTFIDDDYLDMDYYSAYTSGGMDVSNALVTEDDLAEMGRAPDPRAVELLQLLRDELRAITLADKTTYEHHEPRKHDGALPRIEGGTCWRTPRQLSERAISKIDAFLTAHPAPAQNEGGERG